MTSSNISDPLSAQSLDQRPTNSPVHIQHLSDLPPYPFPRMRALLEGITPQDEGSALNMSIGEPQHQPAQFILDALTQQQHLYNKYPPLAGHALWQEAVLKWLQRRNNIPDTFMTADHILPLNGSREGIFSLGLVIRDHYNMQSHKQHFVLPNPYYQPYSGTALIGQGDILYLNALRENNFYPDYSALSEEQLTQTKALFICNPSNPHGTIASREMLIDLMIKAKHHDFILIGDECYSEIYDQEAPISLIELAYDLSQHHPDFKQNPLKNIIVFNSLSKRSNLAGLRSGFIAGDGEILARFKHMRQYSGAPLPLPIQLASAKAWSDEEHVIHNRALYHQKFDLAEQYLQGHLGFYRPQGGFCLWLDVSQGRFNSGEEACKALWQQWGIKSLPGLYLSYEANPQAPLNEAHLYIRLVLVHDNAQIEPALEKIVKTL